MKKYEEEHYQYEQIKERIYPVLRSRFYDKDALNGKHLSENNTLAIQFLDDLMIFFAIGRNGDSYEIFQDAMLPPQVTPEELFETACANLARDVEYVIGNTWYGAYAILADGIYETSALLLKHIWTVCADKLKDDLVICAPTGDLVLFAPVSQTDVVKKIREDCERAYEGSEDPISKTALLFHRKEKELAVYRG